MSKRVIDMTDEEMEARQLPLSLIRKIRFERDHGQNAWRPKPRSTSSGTPAVLPQAAGLQDRRSQHHTGNAVAPETRTPGNATTACPPAHAARRAASALRRDAAASIQRIAAVVRSAKAAFVSALSTAVGSPRGSRDPQSPTPASQRPKTGCLPSPDSIAQASRG